MTKEEFIDALERYESALAEVLEAAHQDPYCSLVNEEEEYVTGYEVAGEEVKITYVAQEHGYYDSSYLTTETTAISLKFLLADDDGRKTMIALARQRDVEAKARQNAAFQAQQEAQERAVLAALKQKYGDH